MREGPAVGDFARTPAAGAAEEERARRDYLQLGHQRMRERPTLVYGLALLRATLGQWLELDVVSQAIVAQWILSQAVFGSRGFVSRRVWH